MVLYHISIGVGVLFLTTSNTIYYKSTLIKKKSKNNCINFYYQFLGGFGDFYTMKRSQHPGPEQFINSLLEGYDELVNRVSALEKKLM